MSRKELKKSDKQQQFVEINHELLINWEKMEEKSLKNLRKPNNKKIFINDRNQSWKHQKDQKRYIKIQN